MQATGTGAHLYDWQDLVDGDEIARGAQGPIRLLQPAGPSLASSDPREFSSTPIKIHGMKRMIERDDRKAGGSPGRGRERERERALD